MRILTCERCSDEVEPGQLNEVGLCKDCATEEQLDSNSTEEDEDDEDGEESEP